MYIPVNPSLRIRKYIIIIIIIIIKDVNNTYIFVIMLMKIDYF